MLSDMAVGELPSLVVDAVRNVSNNAKSKQEWKQLFINTGKFFLEYEKEADRIFDDLSEALSSENMRKFAEEISTESGYELKTKLNTYIISMLRSYDIPEDMVQTYSIGISNTILSEIQRIAPEKYDHYYLANWREENSDYLKKLASKIEKLNASVSAFNEKQVKVYSADQKDIELKRKTINPRIGIDFFEIDDDNFKSDFKNQLQYDKVCVRGSFVEETIYCILNELWRIKDPRPAFVVQSEEDWETLRSTGQEGNIFIPSFVSDEICPIEKNTNIFIYTENIPAFSNAVIDLRPRTYSTLSRCLVRAGMDMNAANELVAETHGLYAALRKKIFNGQILKQPEWLSKLNDKVKKTCLLLGQWTDCDGDKTVVENLSGIKYSEFIDQILPYSKGEDPFVHIVNIRGKQTYYLASVENSWEYLDVSVKEDSWKSFSELFLEVLKEPEKIFTYDQKDLLIA